MLVLVLEYLDSSSEWIFIDMHFLNNDLFLGLVGLACQIFIDLVQYSHRLS